MELIKSHPYISIGALLASVAVIFYVSASGGGAVVSTADPNAVAAGTALQQSQMQQQVQLQGITAGLQAEQDKNATAIALANIQAKYGYDTAQLAAGVQTATISAQQQVAELTSTLSAQTQQAQIKAQTDAAQIAANATIQTTATVANALVAQSAQQAAVAMSAIENQCHGFGCLF